jgi:hypothetical protein
MPLPKKDKKKEKLLESQIEELHQITMEIARLKNRIRKMIELYPKNDFFAPPLEVALTLLQVAVEKIVRANDELGFRKMML